MSGLRGRALVAAAAFVAFAALAGTAWAIWSTVGSGSGSGAVGTLAPPSAVSATQAGSAVNLSWTGTTNPAGGPVDGYYVQRSTGTPGGTCASSPTSLLPAAPTSCSDAAAPVGTYPYTVVAVYRTWTASAQSAPVTVAASLDHFVVTAPASSTAGSPFSVTVAAKDSAGAALTGYTGRVHLTSSDSQAILPSDYTFVTADAGSHTFANATALKTAGSRTITVNDTVQTSATGSASVSVSPAAAAKLRYSQQPTNATAGVTIAPAVTVRIEDQFDNLTSSTANVSLSISGGATLIGTPTRAAVAGVATFNDLSVNTAGSYTLTATSGTLTGATSTSFTISPAAAAKLRYSQQPTNATAGATIAPAVTVRIEDQFDNLTSSTANVGLSVSGGATLIGTTPKAAVAGVATFNDLKVNTAGTYTLAAASTGLTGATSTSFTISPAAAAKLRYSQQPTNATAGATIAPAVTVRIEDQFDNLTSSTANVGLSVSGGATLIGTPTRAAVAGVATFNDLKVNTAGSYTLAATSTGLTVATSNSFTISAAAASKLCIVATLPTCSGATLNVANGSTTTTQIRIFDQFDNVATTTTAITVTFQKSGQVGSPTPDPVTIAIGQSTSGDFSVTINTGSGKSGTVTAKATGLTDGSFTLRGPV